MNLSALARITFQAIGEFWNAVKPSEAEARMLSRMYPDMDALNEIEAELEVHESGPYLKWGGDDSLRSSCLGCGYPHSTETQCLRDGSISFKSYDSMSSPGVPPPGASPGGEVESRPETTAPSSPGVDPSGANGSIPPGAVPGEGPSDSAIPPAPEGHPNLAELIAEVLAEHEPWGSISGFVNCYNHSAIETLHAHCNDWAAWREHVSVNIANRILLRTPAGALWEAQ